MYMLDTNTLIYFFKDVGKVASQLLSHSPNDIIIPSTVIYELHVGIAKSDQPQKRETQLSALLQQIKVNNFTLKEAIEAAQIRADLEKKGTPIGPIDTLIAAHARANNRVLVTHNTKEFQRVEGLVLEDWY
jgi:tRNA(fMet)-specific endonuclease VapC